MLVKSRRRRGVSARLAEPLRGLATAVRNPHLRQQRGGAVAVGVAGVVRMAPAAAVAPFASLLGDRYRRLRMLLVNEIVWTAALVASALAFFAHAPTVLVYVLAGITGACSTILRPTLAALLPWLSPTSEQLVAANAALTTSRAMQPSRS